MRACRACDRKVRKLIKALVIGYGFSAVCADCAKVGILICARMAPVRAETKVVASDDLKDAIAEIERKRVHLKAAGLDDRNVEGIDMALSLLRRKKENP